MRDVGRAGMTTEQIIGLVLALLVMCVGLIGSVLPALPSTPIVLLTGIGHKLYFGEAGAAWWVLGVLGAIVAVSLTLDYAASLYGAKKLGATWRGAVGAVVGGLVGLFFNLPGILLGPFLGAVLFELAGGRDWRDSSKAGLGATLGLLAGALGKLASCIVMMLVFTISVVLRST